MAFRGPADFLYFNFFSSPFPSNSSIYLFFLLRVLSLLFHQIIVTVLFPLHLLLRYVLARSDRHSNGPFDDPFPQYLLETRGPPKIPITESKKFLATLVCIRTFDRDISRETFRIPRLDARLRGVRTFLFIFYFRSVHRRNSCYFNIVASIDTFLFFLSLLPSIPSSNSLLLLHASHAVCISVKITPQ